MAIRLVVFDVAGTTVEVGGAVHAALHDAVRAAGPTLRPGAIAGVAGLAKPLAIRTLLEGHGRDELLPRVPAIHDDFVRRMQHHFRHDPTVRPVAGVEDAFRALRAAGVKVALNTGFSRDVLDILLERLHWTSDAGLIDMTIASDEVSRGRPWPDMIDAIRERLEGIASSAVAKVGDTPVDLQEGTVARCGLVIGVCNGSHSRDELAQHPHDAIVDSAADVPSLVLRPVT